MFFYFLRVIFYNLSYVNFLMVTLCFSLIFVMSITRSFILFSLKFFTSFHTFFLQNVQALNFELLVYSCFDLQYILMNFSHFLSMMMSLLLLFKNSTLVYLMSNQTYNHSQNQDYWKIPLFLTLSFHNLAFSHISTLEYVWKCLWIDLSFQ